ncbi:MAG: hypothetical protein V1848_01060 [Candidatus Magasanikbacteria bacterium]
MSLENNSFESQQEQGESFVPTLHGLLEALQQEGVSTLSAEEIKKQLDEVGVAIVTREYGCGIRISRRRSSTRGDTYTTWTTNGLEKPDHPLTKKYGRKNITIE